MSQECLWKQHCEVLEKCTLVSKRYATKCKDKSTYLLREYKSGRLAYHTPRALGELKRYFLLTALHLF